MEKRRGKVVFILAIIFAVISALIFAYFLAAAIEIAIDAKSGEPNAGLAAVFGLIIFLPLWMISGPASGLITGVLAAFGLRYSKWAYLMIALAVLYAAAPFIYILIFGAETGSNTEEAMLAINSLTTFAL